MNTTSSMMLGIGFVVLGVTAVLLQAWLWNPKYWDEAAKKTHAPRPGLVAHKLVGYSFGAIYLVMMWNMLPRLWEYQVELPARTVVHAVAAIVLGVLLFTKIAILRWFRYFEEAMPKLGLGILTCTVVIGTLSIPFALRAEGYGFAPMDPANVERVRGLLATVEFEEGVDREALVTEDALARGRRVLVGECVRCHDMRTILAKPRTAGGWYDVVMRMTEKPSVFGEPIALDDVPFVTAYLVAITPEIQESRKLAAAQERERAKMIASVVDGLTGGGGGSDTVAPAEAAVAKEPTPTPAAAPAAKSEPAVAVDEAQGKALLGSLCTQCHELDEVEKHGGDDPEGWSKVVRAMVAEGAEISEPEAKQLVPYLAKRWPKK
jgi:mono/diheme cytochrome c family protein